MSSNGIFVSQPNPIIGRPQWTILDADYDFKQEIARSAYADMLHDKDRNVKYYDAIELTIKRMKSEGKTVTVLDIGTGTGLLSMMAVKAGADVVYACEAFAPVAKCASNILRDNAVSEKITLIPKRSTDIIVGQDLPIKPNLLVAELLDTELIGEGVLETYKHAIDNLLSPEAIFIPCRAKLYLQVVESPFLWSHHRLLTRSVDHPEKEIGPKHLSLDAMDECSGCPSVMDLQVSELKVSSSASKEIELKCLLKEPTLVEEFVFSAPTDNILLENNKLLPCTVNNDISLASDWTSSIAHAFVVWWTVQMEPTGTVANISIAPEWSGDKNAAWRDHWMQAVYFPRQAVSLVAGQKFSVAYCRDAVSMWLDLHTATALPNGDQDAASTEFLASLSDRPICECGLHIACSRPRLAQLNTAEYRATMADVANDVCRLVSNGSASCCLLTISDTSLLPMMLVDRLQAVTGVTHHQIDASPLSRRVFRQIYDRSGVYAGIQLHDNVEDTIKQLQLSQSHHVFVVAEPSLSSSVLPWNPLYHWYCSTQLRDALPETSVSLVAPTRLRIYAVAMQFRDLWKIRAPLGADCEGFDLRKFDQIIQRACDDVDAPIEPQPLWEYPGIARSQPTLIFDMDLREPPQMRDATTFILPENTIGVKNGELTISQEEVGAHVNGVAFWADWNLSISGEDVDRWYSPSGPIKPIVDSQQVVWSHVGPQQGVFLDPMHRFDAKTRRIVIRTEFNMDKGEPIFVLEPDNS